MRYRLIVPARVVEFVAKLPPTLKQNIREAMDDLVRDPLIGKPLRSDLAGQYTYRVKRYRIIYAIVRERVEIHIITIGHRATVYEPV